jgi:acetyl esterase/lipase
MRELTCFLSLCLVLLAAVVEAQPAAAPAIVPVPIAPPDQSQAIALNQSGGGLAEQWENFHGDQIVRNVRASTLTPLLSEPSKANGAAVIVAPGGAFLYLSMSNEGYPVARWLADHGIAAFVLKYRTHPTPRDPKELPGTVSSFIGNAMKSPEGVSAIKTPPEALEDAEAAVKLVRARAKEWHIDPARVGFLGFSAGAMTALSVGLTAQVGARPDFIAPIYGPMSALAIPADAPPMFVAVALDDVLMAQGKKLDLIDSWRSAGRPVEAHLYAHGNHGFGMSGRRPASALWIEEFYAWMSDSGLLKPSAGR